MRFMVKKLNYCSSLQVISGIHNGNQPEVGIHVLGILSAQLRVLQVLLVNVHHTSRQAPEPM